MKNKKGISPLISTVLIVGFTIVLAVLVISWINETVNTATDKTDLQVELNNKCLSLVGKVDVDASYNGVDTIVKVTNKGGQDFGFTLLWLDSSGEIGATVDVPSIGDYGFWGDGIQPGDYATVKVIPYFDNSGASCGEEFDEPVIDSTGSGPTYSCPNTICEVSLGETCENCIQDCVGDLAVCGFGYTCMDHDFIGNNVPSCEVNCDEAVSAACFSNYNTCASMGYIDNPSTDCDLPSQGNEVCCEYSP